MFIKHLSQKGFVNHFLFSFIISVCACVCTRAYTHAYAHAHALPTDSSHWPLIYTGVNKMAQWERCLLPRLTTQFQSPESTWKKKLYSDLSLYTLTTITNNNNNKFTSRPPYSISVLYLFISITKWVWL